MTPNLVVNIDGSHPAPRLADGSAPMEPNALLKYLEETGVTHTTIQHRAVFTVEEAKRYRGDIPGAHTKNLFVRNKKGKMWLITARFGVIGQGTLV